MKRWNENMEPERIEQIKHTLYIGRSHTHCGNCGRETLGDSKTHDKIAGYGAKGEPGCGIEWKYITNTYFDGSGDEQKIIRSLRPDLEYVDPLQTLDYAHLTTTQE